LPVIMNDAIAGYDEGSVWARILGRDKLIEVLTSMLDEEEATYMRLMEFARRGGTPAVQRTMA